MTRPLHPSLIKSLSNGFYGPRPGSNFFPLLQLGHTPNCIYGDELENWVRNGWLTARPVSAEPPLIKGGNAGEYGVIPDVELTHQYHLTYAGRSALELAAR